MPPAPYDEAAYSIRSHLESLLQEEFFNRKVQALVDARVSDRVLLMTETYLNRNLPGLISRELLEQVPKFLDQNSVMRDILTKHKSDLSQELNQTARMVVQRIAEEPQYHDIRSSYVRAIDEKFSAQLTYQNNTFEKNMKERMRLVDDADSRIQKLEMWNKITTLATMSLTCGLIFALYRK